jgi:acyl carrier protein
MTQTRGEAQVVWDLLWSSLAGGSYDVEALKGQAHDGSHFVEDLHIDSLDLVEFYVRVQDHFHVDFEGDEFPNLTSVAAVTDSLRAKADTSTTLP